MRILKLTLFVIGAFLLSLNIVGLFKTMRNPAVHDEEITRRNRINDISIPYPEIKKLLVKQEGESDKDFAIRINTVVKDGFIHYWKKEGIDKYYLRVPPWENYLLWIASYVNPKRYERYEFTDYRKNLERGAGLCSTHSTIVKGVLNDHGIEADLLDIWGHVVVRAEVDKGEWYMLDPDYGIVVPHDTAAIHADPEIVRPYYAELASQYYEDAIDPYTTDHLVKIYGRHGNKIYRVYNPWEKVFYRLIWIIPVALMAPFGIGYFLSRRSKTEQKERTTV